MIFRIDIHLPNTYILSAASTDGDGDDEQDRDQDRRRVQGRLSHGHRAGRVEAFSALLGDVRVEGGRATARAFLEVRFENRRRETRATHDEKRGRDDADVSEHEDRDERYRARQQRRVEERFHGVGHGFI